MSKSNLKPTFIGIGAEKSATTWLHSILISHPQIWLPPQKEIHFFDRKSQYSYPINTRKIRPFFQVFNREKINRLKRNLSKKIAHISNRDWKSLIWWSKWYYGYFKDDNNWYINLFSLVTSEKICGEITPSYSCLSSHEVAQIKEINPELKIIFLIRNPMERAWSHLRYFAYKNFMKVKLNSEEEIISTLKQDYVKIRSDYERTINTYLEHFNSQQILIGFYDAIIHDLPGFLSDITDFLEIDKFEQSLINNQKKVNVSPAKEIPLKVKEYLIETYTPMIDRLGDKYGSYAQLWSQSLKNGDITYNHIFDNLSLKPTFHP